MRCARMACLFGLVTLGFAPTGARADFETQTQTVGFVNKPTQFASSLTFNKFDDQNGTLELVGVDLTLNQSIQSTVTISFTTFNTTITVSAKNSAVTTSAPPGFTLGLGGPGQPDQFSASEPDFTITQQSPADLSQVFSEVRPPESASFSHTYSQPAELSQFIGAGTFSLPVIGTAQSTFFSSTGNGFGRVTTQANASGTITFRFVPEPSSAVLFGLGAGACLLAARMRRKLRGRSASQHRTEDAA